MDVLQLLVDNLKAVISAYPPFKNYFTFNGAAASGDRIDNILINESNYTFLFAEGYYMNVHQQSVSEAAFNYWSQVGIIVNRTGEVFDPPPGSISTNIKNLDNPDERAFGFFYATEEHTLRFYVSPKLGRNPSPQCPASVSPQPVYCCNCLYFEGSTDLKPDWWVE